MGKPFEIDTLYILSLAGVILFLNIPAFILLIDYYLENKNTRVEISEESNYIKIIQNKNSTKYQLTEIKSSTLHLGIYYRNRIDNARRWKVVHSDFGYWDLEFENGDRFYLSNLLVDCLHEKAFIENTLYRYRMFPTIDKSNSKKALEIRQFHKEKRINKLRENYKNKTITELKYIVENKEMYQDNAISVAKKLLKEKTLGNNI